MGTQSITGITSHPGAKIYIIDKGEWTEEIWEPVPIADSAGPGAASSAVSAGTDWPKLNGAAYHGLAGNIVHTILPHTEADPVALLANYLVYFGSALGRGPFCVLDGRKHYTNLFIALAGSTGEGRKGTSDARIRPLLKAADPDWAFNCITGGISSGEGILEAICDEQLGTNKKGEEVVTKAGVEDKRLMIVEPELGNVFEIMRREGNTASPVIRNLWDCPETARTMTKNNKTCATNPFVSILGHITPSELQDKLDRASAANGYANRFMFICVKRSKLLPHGGALAPAEANRLGTMVHEALVRARTMGEVGLTAAAHEQWGTNDGVTGVYHKLETRPDNLIGAITARAAPQVRRLAMLYALLDGRSEVDCVHLDAALALWAFAEASARRIFVGFSGDPVADTIIRALLNVRPDGLRTWDLTSAVFGRQMPSGQIHEALGRLLTAGKVRRDVKKTGRYQTEVWFAV
jgi:Protein of unknown function (DUF3987)